MTILAFLQNQWVRDPEKTRRAIAAAEDPVRYRRRWNKYALFAGCRTGQNLRKAFGDLCDEIIWEEASLEIGGRANSVFPADLEHMGQCIAELRPEIVLGFGRVAVDALDALTHPFSPYPPPFALVTAPHPTARQSGVMMQLGLAARRVRALLPAEVDADVRSAPASTGVG
jgi:hypothetical protein